MEGVTTSFPCAAQDLSLNLGFLIRGMPMESLGDGSTWMQRLRGCTKHSPAWEHPGACRGPRTRARPVPGERLRAGRGRREPTAQAAAAGGGAAEPPGEGLEPRCPGFAGPDRAGFSSRGISFPAQQKRQQLYRPAFAGLGFSPPRSVQRPPGSSWAPSLCSRVFKSPRGGRRLQGALPDSPRAQGGVALLVLRVCGPLPALGCL